MTTMRTTWMIVFLISATAAWGAPRVSVTRFDQEVPQALEGCDRWSFGTQDQLRTVLERELSLRDVTVLERKDLRRIHADEHLLPNLDKRSAPKANGFLAAEYTVTGAITELGVCQASSRTGVQLGGLVGLLGGPTGVDLAVGGREATSKVTLVAQLVSVETGAIVRSFTAKAEVKETARAGSVGFAGVGVERGERSEPPIERASNEALRDLAEQIAQHVRGTQPTREPRSPAARR